MKLESLKSLTLAILIVISLALTFGLWSYQPSNEPYKGQEFQNNTGIGGKELTKQQLIEPSEIIFHAGDQHFGFTDPAAQQSLYREIQSWTLYDFRLLPQKENQPDGRRVEIQFPGSIPMQSTKNLLTYNEPDSVVLPNWSFTKIIITFNQKKSILGVHFLSENGQQATATISNLSNYNELWTTIEKEGLTKLTPFTKGTRPIYVPSQPVTMEKIKYTVTSIEPTTLVRTLFPDTNKVNISNGVYSDSVRGMRIKANGRKMEYFNPLDPTYNQITPADLLEISIKNINGHKGWTDDYRLVFLNRQTNTIRYRLFCEGYPAFSNSDLTTIEQQWQNTDLLKYNRSLIQLERVLGNRDEITMSSGGVIEYLTNEYAAVEEIQDIKLGYHYKYENETSNLITLAPSWFIKVNGDWKNFEDLLPMKGGAQDAVEPN